MSETILILDSDENAAANTQAQMLATARRYGIGGIGGPQPVTEVGGPRVQVAPQVLQVPPDFGAAPPAVPMYAAPTPMVLQPLQLADHLLITPSKRDDLVRLVRMRGSEVVAAWVVPAEACSTVGAILQAFGITLTDLRESEESDESTT